MFKAEARWYILLSAIFLSIAVAAQTVTPTLFSASQSTVPAGTLLRMELSGPLNVAHLKPGSELDGALIRPVYVYDRALIPAGSQVRAVVDKVEKEKAAPKHGLLERLDSVRSLGLGGHKLYQVSLRSATVKLPSGQELPLDLKFIRSGEEVRLQANNEGQLKVGGSTGKDLAKHAPVIGQVSKIKHDKRRVQEFRHPLAMLELERPVNLDVPGSANAPQPTPQPVTIPEGTRAEFLLLTELRASENKVGDNFQARLVEPIFQPDGKLVLPEGSVLDGHISKLTKPRRMSRAAAMYLVFDRLTFPGGEGQKVAASLAAADVGKKAAVNMDPEGGLHGSGGGKNLAKRFAVGAVSEHAVDEAVEMATHAVAPYAGVGTGLVVLLAGHGNDVDLPQYSDLEVRFGRPVRLATGSAQTLAPEQK